MANDLSLSCPAWSMVWTKIFSWVQFSPLPEISQDIPFSYLLCVKFSIFTVLRDLSTPLHCLLKSLWRDCFPLAIQLLLFTPLHLPWLQRWMLTSEVAHGLALIYLPHVLFHRILESWDLELKEPSRSVRSVKLIFSLIQDVLFFHIGDSLLFNPMVFSFTLKVHSSQEN